MFNYLKRVIEDGSTKTPSSKRWAFVISTISLNIGFLAVTGAMLFGVVVSDAVVLGLAGILAGLTGGAYTYAKKCELAAKKRDSQDE